MKRLVPYVIILLLFLPIGSGQYYADVTIYLEENTARIEGDSNHPLFEEREITIENSHLTLQTNDTFTDYIYTVYSSSTIEILEVNTTATTRISPTASGLQIKGVATNKPFNLSIQYTVNDAKNAFSYWWLLLISTIIAGFPYYIYNKKDAEHTIPSDVSERQKQILEYINDNGSVTQQDISQALNIPKSSVSRNIKSLEKQGYILVSSTGNSNTIQLQDDTVSNT